MTQVRFLVGAQKEMMNVIEETILDVEEYITKNGEINTFRVPYNKYKELIAFSDTEINWDFGGMITHQVIFKKHKHEMIPIITTMFGDIMIKPGSLPNPALLRLLAGTTLRK